MLECLWITWTKWPEAFAIQDKKAETVAKLFVEQIVCKHGIYSGGAVIRLWGEFPVLCDPGGLSVVEQQENQHMGQTDAYRVSAQASARESPFFLLYGRDA